MIGSLVSNTTKFLFQRTPASSMLIQTRNKMKTHKAAAKRFIKTGNGYKRKQAGRNHGNGRFSASTLSHLDPFVAVTAKGGHLKKLKEFL